MKKSVGIIIMKKLKATFEKCRDNFTRKLIMKNLFYFLCLVLITGCSGQNSVNLPRYASVYDSLFRYNPAYISSGFDYPVGKPDAKGYYDAQPYGQNTHLGNDWNSNKGGNSDLGDPVYSISEGYVSCVQDFGGGWGNVVRMVHCLDTVKHVYVKSLYAHFQEILVKKGQFVKRGTQIGKIGNCNGHYYAHLHFEIRRKADMELGGGYSSDTTGFFDPTAFIKKHRPRK